MLTAEGCRQRRQRFWKLLDPRPETDHLRLADPLHLAYLAGFTVDPISLNAGFGGVLIVREDGNARLLASDRLKAPAEAAHVDERTIVPWYDGQTPGKGPRQLALVGPANPAGGMRFHDRPGDPYAATATGTLARMRRQKDADEIELMKQCMRATEAGHAWGRANARAGMTELDVYSGIAAACTKEAGKAVVVYGDFAVCTGPERRGGPATSRVLADGDMMILDFSVVIDQYRSDFTNTLVIGGKPTPVQQELYERCLKAMAAGEKQLRAGSACQAVFDAVAGELEKDGYVFPHHAGHGLGLTHPEAPFFVRHSDETLLAGDVVTLEPGVYIDGVGGIRIENNYLVTQAGYERLSNHEIVLS